MDLGERELSDRALRWMVAGQRVLIVVRHERDARVVVDQLAVAARADFSWLFDRGGITVGRARIFTAVGGEIRVVNVDAASRMRGQLYNEVVFDFPADDRIRAIITAEQRRP